MKKVSFFFLFVFILLSSFLPTSHAVTISTALPGSYPINASSSPGAFVANFYSFALIIAGVLAFGDIVYGGIRYMTSTGNPSGESDAKEWIEAALLGLLLLAGAYFILGVINPQLLDLNLPTLKAVNIGVAPANSGLLPAGPNGQTLCAGKIDGQCAYSSQSCAPDGNGNYSCQSNKLSDYTCKGSQYGTCPSVGPVLCVNNGTVQKPNYMCSSS